MKQQPHDKATKKSNRANRQGRSQSAAPRLKWRPGSSSSRAPISSRLTSGKAGGRRFVE